MANALATQVVLMEAKPSLTACCDSEEIPWYAPRASTLLEQVFHRTSIERPSVQTRSVHFTAAADIPLTVYFDPFYWRSK
ncbi:hypothetical protein OUZ56_005744 [Daphnia magna]|uniref:Uncharacterized protein n=1 Tax=Daphnia magna TaxID=35525 RepID=A0ABQ9YV06_9CRUS|nr:hypothetical protein OUZ56_005744 [Daphnia magna]